MFKIYNNGIEFINENKIILDSNSIIYSFYQNALAVTGFTKNTYCIKLYDDTSFMFIVNDGIHNTLFNGDIKFAADAAKIIFGYNLSIDKILGDYDLIMAFYNEYRKLTDASYQIHLDMDIMIADKKCKLDLIPLKPTEKDIDEIAELMIKFLKECSDEDLDWNIALERARNSFNNFYVIKKDDKIISMARKSRETEDSCCTNCVYTIPAERGKGYARSCVGMLLNEIIDSNKTPYLYVDRANPISNHIYEALSYKSKYHQAEIHIKSNYKNAIFAGGCFWCMSKPYYDYDGVKHVFSGYQGGTMINPTYEDVKHGQTHHREVVRIVYDPKMISYKELLTIFFENIDPFDDGGQFIDRGENYTTAVFTEDLDEIASFKEIRDSIENKYLKEVKVARLPEYPFYMAEEYHQDFALKNIDKFELEEEISGRNAFDFIKIK